MDSQLRQLEGLPGRPTQRLPPNGLWKTSPNMSSRRAEYHLDPVTKQRPAWLLLLAVIVCLLVLASPSAHAGPPFFTDDPETLEARHWEFYLATQLYRNSEGWTGTSPHIEINYGVTSDLQLHLITPMAFSAPIHETAQFGYGDTEFGVKYRFLSETDHRPQIGIYPLLEIPTGNASRGLGEGHLDVFIPIWLQKSFGKWTTFGGGGYWIDPGRESRNWWFLGWALERKITSKLTLGAEIIHETPKAPGESSITSLTGGVLVDFSDTYHFAVSAGHTIHGADQFQAYAAFLITFGPEKPRQKPTK